MGFRFGKSFKLPGGFRINLSTKGVGASFGVKGLRFSVGPGGARVSASLPGTGIGWSGSFFGGAPKPPRPARAGYRAALQAKRGNERMLERERNANEVALFESRVALLTSMHKEASPARDWRQVADAPEPPPPPPPRAREAAAAKALADYAPNAIERLLNAGERRRRELAAEVEFARRDDAEEHRRALEAHARQLEPWRWLNGVARGVLAGDPEACRAALESLLPLEELEEVGSELEVGLSRPYCVEAWFKANSSDDLPTETLSLTPTGRLSRKKMPPGRYWALYQDHVASAAFRVGREIFALLPVPFVLVHVSTPTIDRSTGRRSDAVVLSVVFEREAFSKLDFEHIDPSEVLSQFGHEMSFKKTTGFCPVECVNPDQLGVEDESV
jgi:Protein of unknown function (DUF4236)